MKTTITKPSHLLLFLALLASSAAWVACQSLGSVPAVCPVGVSPIQAARTALSVAELVCAGKPCAPQVDEVSAVINQAEATREQICEQWPAVELVAATVNQPKLSAAVAIATRALDCGGAP